MHSKVPVLYLCLTWAILVATVIGEDRKIVILQTSDIHARVTRKDGAGWLRLATAIKAERQASKSRCIWVDCGDSIQGTLAASMSRGAVSIAAMRSLKVDAWIPGNHELDFGVGPIRSVAEKKLFPVLNGNLSLDGNRLPDYRIVKVGDVRVAIIGMNSSRLNSWFVGPKYKGLKMESAVERLEKVLPELMKEKPNLVVLGIHDGLSPDGKGGGAVVEVAKRFPQIKVIMGGHTHQDIPGKRLWGAHVVQPGRHGQFLSKIEVSFDTDGKVSDIRSKLIDVTTLAPDPETKKKLTPYMVDEMVYGIKRLAPMKGTVTSTGTPGIDNHLSEIICRAMTSASDAKVALHGVHGEFGLKGPWVNRFGLFSCIPYENQVFIVSMSKDDLKRVIEEQTVMLGDQSIQGIYGMQVWLNADKAVSKMGWPENVKTVKVAVTGYCAAGGGGRYPVLRSIVEKSTVTVLKKNTRQLLEDYVRSDKEWEAPPKHWLHPAERPVKEKAPK